MTGDARGLADDNHNPGFDTEAPQVVLRDHVTEDDVELMV
jgi:hypothetical protein